VYRSIQITEQQRTSLRIKATGKRSREKKKRKRKRGNRLDGKRSEITIAKTIGHRNITYQIKIEITCLCKLSVKL